MELDWLNTDRESVVGLFKGRGGVLEIVSDDGEAVRVVSHGPITAKVVRRRGPKRTKVVSGVEMASVGPVGGTPPVETAEVVVVSTFPRRRG